MALLKAVVIIKRRFRTASLNQQFVSNPTCVSCDTTLMWEDNSAVVSILNNYAMSVPGMRDDLHAIMAILEMEDAWMQTRYVRSAENPAD